MPVAELGEVSLYYKKRGEGPLCLGIMGFGLDQRFWAAQIPAVTATHTFITFDNRGIGRSQGPPAERLEELADDAVGLLDHLDIGRCVVFGVSMGGAIAQHIALAHPERVSALVLGVTWARPIEFMRRQSALADLLVGTVGPDGLIESTLVRMFTPRFFEIGSEAIDRMLGAFFTESGPELAGPGVLKEQLAAIDTHDTLGALSSVRCPTLVLGGRMDMMVPFFASEEIAAAIPGARLVAFETGHGCMVEEMDEFNAALDGFLRELTAD